MGGGRGVNARVATRKRYRAAVAQINIGGGRYWRRRDPGLTAQREGYTANAWGTEREHGMLLVWKHKKPISEDKLR